MAMINVGEFKKGTKVLLDGNPYDIMECQFVKPGKGSALYKTKLRNLLSGKILDRTYRSGDGLEGADIRKAAGTYSFRDPSGYVFMENTTFEQHTVLEDVLGDVMKFVSEGAPFELVFWNDRVISATPPQHVELEVTYAEPAARGNTATNVTKMAEVSTGAQVQVPAHIEAGNVIKIETSSGLYVERVST